MRQTTVRPHNPTKSKISHFSVRMGGYHESKTCSGDTRPESYITNYTSIRRVPESRRCSRDTYPESNITKYTSIRRQMAPRMADSDVSCIYTPPFWFKYCPSGKHTTRHHWLGIHNCGQSTKSHKILHKSATLGKMSICSRAKRLLTRVEISYRSTSPIRKRPPT